MGANYGILHLAFNYWVYFDLYTFSVLKLIINSYWQNVILNADKNFADFRYTVTESALANKLKCTCLHPA